MESVRFIQKENTVLTVARIDEILSKGHLEDFVQLINIFLLEPNGEAAMAMEKLFHSANLNDPEFYAKHQFLAAYHVIKAVRQYPLFYINTFS
jgi:hypothetical protein